MINFYNTLSKKKEKFVPLQEGEARIYSCGPTVYNYAHIGNWRSFVFSDILKRYLRFRGFKVIDVMNITDIDDKTIKGSINEGIPLKDFTDKYTKAFFDDMKTLNIIKAHVTPKATEHIKEIVALIQKIVANGHTYESDGSIYFKISTFKDYGKLANLKFDDLMENAQGRLDSDSYEKENARDFVLWKAWKPEDRDVFWDTELGKGRPGWHIECSAMSMKYLGETLDIHTGGYDLIFPHHTNEIAQSESGTGKRFVKYWLHNEFLLIDKEKMSKSLGNFFTLRDLLSKGMDAMAIRYILLATHYRQQVNFTDEGISAAKNAIDKLNNFIKEMKDNSKPGDYNGKIGSLIDEALNDFEKAMDDDLNISLALAVVFDFVKEIFKNDVCKKDALKVLEFMERINSVLGFMNFSDDLIPSEILNLLAKRDKARNGKDWKSSDKIRDEIKALGFEVLDTKDGSKARKI